MATPPTTRTYEDWIGLDAYDRTGGKIGEIKNVYYDIGSSRPEWLAVETGWFGMNSSFAPIAGSSPTDNGIQLDVDKDTVKDAPNVGDAGELTVDDETRLYSHYHIDPSGGRDSYTSQERRAHGYDPSRRADEGYDVDEAAITRREEQLDVGTHRKEAGTVRLRKYVTTEHETVTVPVEKERIVVEREPASGTSETTELGDESIEMTAHEEEVDVDKRVVDKETVRAKKQRSTEKEKVEADLRKEQVDVEGDTSR